MILSVLEHQLNKGGTGMKNQRGATLTGMLLVAAMVGCVLILAAKLIPPYLEFMAVKKVINAMVSTGDLKSMTPKEIQASFIKRGDIDNIKSVQTEDITVSREGNQSQITVEYFVKIPIAANISAYIEFSASSSPKAE